MNWFYVRFQQRRVEGIILLLAAIYGLSWGIGRLVAVVAGIDDALISLSVGLFVVLALLFGVVALWYRLRYRRLRAIRMADIDFMDGLDFERYVCRLLERQGYRNVKNVRGSGDFGVDIIAEMDGLRYAIQVKRYKDGVSRRAVSDAVAGKIHFECDASMVVTNSYFTAGAKQLAHSTNCALVDRDQLADWILTFQRG